MRFSTGCLLLLLLVAACSRSGEAARVRSGGGDLEAVVIETPGGATRPFAHQIIVTPRGQPASAGVRVASLDGARRGQSAHGVNLVWVGLTALRIEYLSATRADIDVKLPVRVGTRDVSVGLVPGLDDSTAPAGGMLR